MPLEGITVIANRDNWRATALLLASVATLSPLSVEGVIPSLPQLAQEFDVPAATAQLVVSSLLTGLACGQFLWGALGDRLGRKGALSLALAFFSTASVLCLVSPDATWLILARWLQGVGASGGPVLSRAIVRDWYPGERGVEAMGVLTSVVFIAPALAPVGGGLLTEYWGWRSIHSAMVVLGVVAFIAIRVALSGEPVSGPAARRESLLDRSYLSGLAISALMFFGMFGFVAGSPSLIVGTYGASASQFGLAFFAIALGYTVGAFLGRFPAHLPLPGRVVSALLPALAGALIQLARGWYSLAGLLIAGFAFYVALGMLQPVVIAHALGRFNSSIGLASSCLGAAQMSSGALASFLVGRVHEDTAMSVGIIFLAATILSLAFVPGLKSDRHNPKS